MLNASSTMLHLQPFSCLLDPTEIIQTTLVGLSLCNNNSPLLHIALTHCSSHDVSPAPNTTHKVKQLFAAGIIDKFDSCLTHQFFSIYFRLRGVHSPSPLFGFATTALSQARCYSCHQPTYQSTERQSHNYSHTTTWKQWACVDDKLLYSAVSRLD